MTGCTQLSSSLSLSLCLSLSCFHSLTNFDPKPTQTLRIPALFSKSVHYAIPEIYVCRTLFHLSSLNNLQVGPVGFRDGCIYRLENLAQVNL